MYSTDLASINKLNKDLPLMDIEILRKVKYQRHILVASINYFHETFTKSFPTAIQNNTYEVCEHVE